MLFMYSYVLEVCVHPTSTKFTICSLKFPSKNSIESYAWTGHCTLQSIAGPVDCVKSMYGLFNCCPCVSCVQAMSTQQLGGLYGVSIAAGRVVYSQNIDDGIMNGIECNECVDFIYIQHGVWMDYGVCIHGLWDCKKSTCFWTG